MSNQTNDEAIFQQVLQRSATDREFRTRLVQDPDGALEEIIGVPMASLAKPVRVRFLEKDADIDALIVLPDYLDPEGVLSEAELEAVAGGDWCITSCGFSCVFSNDNTVKVCTA